LGPAFDDAQIQAFLDQAGAEYRQCDTDEQLCDCVAQLLADEKVVGWFQGRMEFGPRALGARSILGDARSSSMQSTMNLKIKFRESFRPFAPSVLAEHAAEYFDLPEGHESPYMLLVAPVAAAQRIEANGAATLAGLDKLKACRSTIPAVTHVDGSARMQTVDGQRHGRFRTLLERFYAKTGCPVLINTSFNVRGEPIVCTPQEAYRCFLSTHIDALVMERFVLVKTRAGVALPSETYLSQFSMD
jgi:carbamoyltransferase